MRVILHLINYDDAILAVRAAKSASDKVRHPGSFTLIEFENGKRFQVNQNKKSVSVWPVPDAPTTTPTRG